MPYTVANLEAGIKRQEFDAYVRLLERRGVDWTNTPRVAEPGSENRWLYVWANRSEAEEFCQDLRKETHDNKWTVQELSPKVRPSAGPLAPVIVLMRRHSLGAEFTLHPHSRTLVIRRFPDARLVTSISIESATLNGAKEDNATLWDHVVQVLTGLNDSQLAQLGGFRVMEGASDRVVFEETLASPV